jgi:hypothetical protein
MFLKINVKRINKQKHVYSMAMHFFFIKKKGTFIGSSFVFKKKGLLQSMEKSGTYYIVMNYIKSQDKLRKLVDS